MGRRCAAHVLPETDTVRKITGILCAALVLGAVSAKAGEADASSAASSGFGALHKALAAGRWSEADAHARALDAALGKGDVFRAYASATRFARNGECDKAVPLARLAAGAVPEFVHAYEPWARCLLRDGNRQGAIDLYAGAARRLPPGPMKDLALRNAAALEPDRDWRFSVSGTLTPSTNTVRQTSQDRIGFLSISEESQAKPGVMFGGDAFATKPLFFRGRLSALVRLRIGFRHETAENLFHPVAGAEMDFVYSASARTSVSLTPFYEHMWTGTSSYRHAAGTRLAVVHALDSQRLLRLTGSLAWHDYANDARDGLQAALSLTHERMIGADDRVTLSVSAARNGARIPVLQSYQASVSAEWEHAFANGFVPSIGATALLRRYDGNAPLSSQKQLDTYLSAQIGISHRNIRLGRLRPEAVFSATRQFSNNPFYDYTAFDGGLRLKAAF